MWRVDLPHQTNFSHHVRDRCLVVVDSFAINRLDCIKLCSVNIVVGEINAAKLAFAENGLG